jgi:hypothetical protein
MTTWAEIDAAAMVLIDDIRIQEQLEISPALYYRRMSLFVTNAMPLLSRPPELLTYLVNGMQAPSYGEFQWTSTAESTTQDTVVTTGMVGYDLCSCIMVQLLNDGRVLQTPYAVTYDAETGEVTFPQQSAEGIVYELDFYTDGEFQTLSPTQLRLFALAVSVVWDERFINGWLQRTPKINDSSFATVNEANWTEKESQAHRRKNQDFFDELKAYEQLCAYTTRVSNAGVSGVTLV